MSTAKPQTGPWGRRLWNVVAILTAIGLVGPVIFLVKVWPAVQQENASRCDEPGFVYGLIEFFLVWLVVLAFFAGAGDRSGACPLAPADAMGALGKSG